MNKTNYAIDASSQASPQTSARSAPPLVYCYGEPAGIGVDLAVELANHDARNEVVVLGCQATLAARAVALGRTIEYVDYPDDASVESLPALQPGQLRIIDRPCPSIPEPGQPLTENAQWILENLDAAWAGIGAGRFAGLVTGPIDKSVVMSAGIKFSGHTEYLAQIDGGRCSVMLLAADTVKVALATTHTPTRDVADVLVGKIKSGEFDTIVRILISGLQNWYDIERPTVAVCGLNPHAGENGRLGTEEKEWMIPALNRLRADDSLNANIIGPVAADTAFIPPQLECIDAHLSMYHDQGLTAVKALAFGRIVNTTLGLSYVRTSVDHGVAYGHTGNGQADPKSLFQAIAEARRLTLARPYS